MEINSIINSVQQGYCGFKQSIAGKENGVYVDLALAALAAAAVGVPVAMSLAKRKLVEAQPVELKEVVVEPVVETKVEEVVVVEEPKVVPKNQDADVRAIFKRIGITEWHLPGQSSNFQNIESSKDKPQPKVILSAKNQKEMETIKDIISKASNENIDQRVGSVPTLIFEGKPGLGKTMLAQDLAQTSGAGFIRIKAGTIGSLITLGKASAALEELFEIANNALVPVYFILDDGEQTVGQRPTEKVKQKAPDAEAYWITKEKAVGELVQERRVEVTNAILEESGKDVRNIGFIVTTNRPEAIDGAFRTRSYVLTFDLPDEMTRRRIMATHIPKLFNYDQTIMKFFDQGRLEKMAKATEEFAGRNLVKLLEKTAAAVEMNNGEITQEIIDSCIVEARRSLDSEKAALYKTIKDQDAKKFLDEETIKKAKKMAEKIVAKKEKEAAKAGAFATAPTPVAAPAA